LSVLESKLNLMADKIEPREAPVKNGDANQPANDVQEKQTDPNLTELKGFVDDDEKLEPEGTDNPDVKYMP
jgi:hypothetical protein